MLTTTIHEYDVAPRMSADDDEDGELIGADDDADMADDNMDAEDAGAEDDEDEA